MQRWMDSPIVLDSLENTLQSIQRVHLHVGTVGTAPFR